MSNSSLQAYSNYLGDYRNWIKPAAKYAWNYYNKHGNPFEQKRYTSNIRKALRKKRLPVNYNPFELFKKKNKRQKRKFKKLPPGAWFSKRGKKKMSNYWIVRSGKGGKVHTN